MRKGNSILLVNSVLVMFFLFTYSLAFSQSNSNFFVISLQDGFNADSISFSIGENPSAKIRNVRSDLLYGHAGIDLLFTYKSDSTYFLSFLYKCPQITNHKRKYIVAQNKFIIYLIVDEKKYTLNIDLKNGNYIGLNYDPYLKKINDIIIFQQFDEFTYE